MTAATPVYVPRLTRDPRPVYHLRGVSRPLREEKPTGYELRTRCGLVAWRYNPDGTSKVVPTLRYDHATQIGRVCETCYRRDARAKGYQP